jgi:hypothetical protein
MYKNKIIHITQPYMGVVPRFSGYTFCNRMIGTIFGFVDSSYFLCTPPRTSINPNQSYHIRLVPHQMTKDDRKVLYTKDNTKVMHKYSGFYEDWVYGRDITICNKCVKSDDFILSTLSHA